MSNDADEYLSRRATLRGVAGTIGAATGIVGLAGSAAADPAGDDVDPSYSTCTPSSDPYPHFVYLDGSCLEAEGDRIKRYPDPDGYDGNWRDWQSPIRDGTIPAGYHRAFSSVETAKALGDTSALDGVVDGGVPAGLQLSVINVKRDDAGTPHYRYFDSDREFQRKEWWSSSKFMAVAAAAAKIRHESYNQVGIDSRVNGRHVGEYVTKIHNYGTDWGGSLPTSNGLAKAFLDVAGKDWASQLTGDWTGTDSELRGGYGYGPAFTYPTFETDDASEQVWNAGETGGGKLITPLASAEFLKRLVMHREDSATRVPGFRADEDADVYWNDLQILFYGQPGWNWGGMQDDTAIYVSSAVDLDGLADGQWRIFSKLGFGKNEFVYTAYACLPEEDDPTSGDEFVISVHWDRNTAISGQDKDQKLQRVIQDVVRAIQDGSVDYQADDPSGTPLRDVQDHWAESEMRSLVDAGVLTGYSDGTIRPDTPVNRAEFATLLVEAFDVSEDTSGGETFSDIAEHWARENVERAAAASFLSGYPDGTFRPEENVTKTEALVALVGGLDSLSSSAAHSELDPFEDRYKVPDWAKDAVAAAVSEGLVENQPIGEWLEPTADATRAEVLKFISEARRSTSASTAVEGQTLTGTVDAEGETTHEYALRAEDPGSVTIDLDGPEDADLDLYITLDGRTPTREDYDRSAWSYGSDEQVSVTGTELPADATLGILVTAYSSGGDYELRIVEDR